MDMERVKQLRNEYTEQHIILKEQFEKFQELLKEHPADGRIKKMP